MTIADVLEGRAAWTVERGDSLAVVPSLPDNSIDAIVTDPPAGISFMGKDWDSFRRAHNPADVGRNTVHGRLSAKAPHSYGESDRSKFIAAMGAIFVECYRALKPGGHALVWALPRTSHWTATALEDAGFEIRDVITHLFGQGFPKSLDVSKALDGVIGKQSRGFNTAGEATGRSTPDKARRSDYGFHYFPTTDSAREWSGWGTALKPASEHWLLCRKPLSEKNVAANVQRWSTGALNIGATRIGFSASDDIHGKHPHTNGGYGHAGAAIYGASAGAPTYAIPKGRWPANVALSHTLFCQPAGTREIASNGHYPAARGGGGLGTAGHSGQAELDERYTAGESVEAWDCDPTCAVRLLDEQSGASDARRPDPIKHNSRTIGGNGIYQGGPAHETARHMDQGGASRFFYTAKAGSAERVKGLDAMPLFGVEPGASDHPTVKSIELMRWLARMITPPGGLILDPFAGSGSTGCAAVLEGFRFIGIDLDAEDRYVKAARRRITYWTGKLPDEAK